ncbi:MAG TPA: endonuclease/exonuclease/phosphatase family protein [Tepidisphaeraceae bacterium]|nr:endonuclease/exonuclease/phosphatase family protein [Tepidisphaeraceae bacterium]
MRLRVSVALIACFSAALARGETITCATYNVENFYQRFLPSHLATRPAGEKPDADTMRELRSFADKELWEVSRVILDPQFNPDVIVFEECCEQTELEKFNHQWLKDAYKTVIVFKNNSERHQNVAMMLKPNFKVIEKKDQYYLENDSVKNERGDRLFARGPAFCLIESPSGYRFWVGVTHQKSKSGNNVEVTQWRNREAKRTHEIMLELQKQGPTDVMLMGDMNDEFGIQEFEGEGGGDVITNLVGPKEDGLILATRPLIDAGEISYGGYWRPEHRSFIDQILLTPSMKDQIEEVKVFKGQFTPVASDHYPVYIKIKADEPTTSTAK